MKTRKYLSFTIFNVYFNIVDDYCCRSCSFYIFDTLLSLIDIAKTCPDIAYCSGLTFGLLVQACWF